MKMMVFVWTPEDVFYCICVGILVLLALFYMLQDVMARWRRKIRRWFNKYNNNK